MTSGTTAPASRTTDAAAEPGTAERTPDEQAADHTRRLTAAGVHTVAVTWVDNAGITRVKAVPARRLGQTAQHGVGFAAIFDRALGDDSFAPGGTPDGDLRLRADLTRLTALTAPAGWAWAPGDRHEQSGEPAPTCQRSFLRRAARRAAERGLTVRAGFETEWTVSLKGDPDEPRPACGGPAYGMARLLEMAGYLAEVHAALDAHGVEVLQLHPEYAPGQFEVSTAPADPVGAADDAVLVRETIRAVSQRHGLVPSFGPVVGPDEVGSGRHLHLSLWRDGHNLCAGGDGPGGMTGDCAAFLAGVLRELPALLALGAPAPASYLRLRPSRWAGAYHCWGVENREAALRFVCPGDLTGANAELKCFDGAANPYLLVGAVIEAGLAGVAEHLTLPPPVTGDPHSRPDRPPRLPVSLAESLDALRGSAPLRAALGEPLFAAVEAVRAAEDAQAARLSPERLAHTTRHRY
ncbi:glutamine synthetase [Streptomyces chumphonensis]|uniref:glutamine synthetase n=1 Tax=Streptomyces chumphonensis TaxID=1214925 RepID=UPI003D73E5A6